MAKLNQDQWIAAQAWLHDVFAWGQLITPKRPIAVSNYWYMYGRDNPKYNKVATDAVQTICDEFLYRKVDMKNFKQLDAALEVLSKQHFVPNVQSAHNGGAVRKHADMLARYIANFCSKFNFLWDNSTQSTYDMDEIKQTILGKELWENKCFASQHATNQQPASTASTSASTASSTSTGTSSAPQNGYKSSGAQSGNMKCLVGQPNQKLIANSSVSFRIEADKIGKNTPNAFIKPLSAKDCPNGAATIYFGSGNGYTDCTCWFDDLSDASAFLAKCQTKFGSKFTNIHITKAKSDANGYFLVNTEFGQCAIKASKMNEQLEEEVVTEEIKEEPLMTSYGPLSVKKPYTGIEDVEMYKECLYKE